MPPRERAWVESVSLGSSARSTITTSRPWRASSIAVGAPAVRAPTITTSCRSAVAAVKSEVWCRAMPTPSGNRHLHTWRSPEEHLESPCHRSRPPVRLAVTPHRRVAFAAGIRRRGVQPCSLDRLGVGLSDSGGRDEDLTLTVRSSVQHGPRRWWSQKSYWSASDSGRGSAGSARGSRSLAADDPDSSRRRERPQGGHRPQRSLPDVGQCMMTSRSVCTPWR